MKLFGMRVGHRESAFSVEVESGATVADLKEAIKACISTELPHLSANQLVLFLAKREDDWVADHSEDMKAPYTVSYSGDASKVIKTPLKSTCILNDLFKDPPDATVHFLVVDSEHPTCHPIRRKRWRELNKRLDRVKKPRINADSKTVVTRFSRMKWGDVEDVLDYTAYTQKRKEVPAERVKRLYDQLMLLFKMLGGCMMDSSDRQREVKRSHFITSVLIHICDLFGDDVQILVNEMVKSNTIHGSGFFDFIIQRGDKKFCIVVAKKENFLQGATEALIGCEAVAEREGLETVYAVVTDFVQWHFYRSGETKIEQDDIALGIKSGIPKFDSIKDLCDLLYGFLADESE